MFQTLAPLRKQWHCCSARWEILALIYGQGSCIGETREGSCARHSQSQAPSILQYYLARSGFLSPRPAAMLAQPGLLDQHLHTCHLTHPAFLRPAARRTVPCRGSQQSQAGRCRASCSSQAGKKCFVCRSPQIDIAAADRPLATAGPAEQKAGRRQTLGGVLAAAALLCTNLSAEAKPTSEVAAQDDTSIVPAGGKVL